MQNFRDGPNDNITQSELLKSKIKITGETPVDSNTKTVKTAMSLKYLSNFFKTFEMPLINCKINLIITWSTGSVIPSTIRKTKFAITDTKFYVSILILSIQDKANLSQELKSDFKRTIYRNKYQSKVSSKKQNQYLDFLIDSSFQGVNRLFVLLFKNDDFRKVHTEYNLSKVKIWKISSD